MEFSTYILYSHSLKKFYVGQTNNLINRLKRHNLKQVKSTISGGPWQIVYSKQFFTRSEAVIMESKIKKRGAKRFLEILEQ